jgi:phenylalanine ammonia-lyase
MGNADITVRVGKGCNKAKEDRGDDSAVTMLAADKALQMLGMKPIVLGPKEGLGLINGTAASAAVASLASNDVNNLAVICQLLASMLAEGMGSDAEWATAFISDVRPHDGQVEAAYNIRSHLLGSKMVTGLDRSRKDHFKKGLIQDRYSLRSSPQWLSPILEDLLAAKRQVETELNSTSDNPVVDVANDDIVCGANFQATAITAASEKVRFCLQMMGRIIFSQASEIINQHHNNGLPPNLAADDPSLSFCLKGVDVNMASYQSELGYLANPVSSHVLSAEMHNQGINSLALLTSRFTMQSVDVLSHLFAAALYTACQAQDLRVLHVSFLDALRPVLNAVVCHHLDGVDCMSLLHDGVWNTVCDAWWDTAVHDAAPRADIVASATLACITEFTTAQGLQQANERVKTGGGAPVAGPGSYDISRLQDLKTAMAQAILEAYLSHRAAFFNRQTTAQFLGRGTRVCYEFVRGELGVPFHRGLVDQPGPGDCDKKTIGSWVSVIYEAIRDDRLIDCIMGQLVV